MSDSPTAREPFSLALRWVIGAAFFASGISALIYQVAWQRILGLQSGVGIYSVAVIVAAFMAGLGIGSFVGGAASRGMAPGRALRIFAFLELGIGSFGLLSCWLLYDVLYTELGWLFAHPVRAGFVQFGSLALPTTLMGMSLPFLAQAVVAQASSAARTLGLFYGLNTCGAALGAVLTPWVLIRSFGIDGAVACAATANLAAGAVIFAASLRLAPGAAAPQRDVPSDEPRVASDEAPLPFAAWIALYALGGFCSLSLEMLWFRVIDVAAKSTAFTFGTVLGIFLLGIGSGSALGGGWAGRRARPLAWYLGLQSSLLAASGLSLWLLTVLPASVPGMGFLLDYWAQYGEFPLGRRWDAGHVFGLYLALPVFLYGIPTFLMGLSFGLLQRAVQDDPATSGFKVGVLQAANIAGNVAGSLLTGLLLLNWVGTTGSVRILLLVGCLFAAVGLVRGAARGPFAVVLAIQLGLVGFLPDNDGFWRRLHGTNDPEALLAEDASGVAALIPEESRMTLFVNGKGHSWIPFGDVHSLLGAAPSSIHPAPRRVAIIGLGSGDTAWAAGLRSTTERVDVFELVEPELEVLEALVERQKVRSLSRFLRDERVHIQGVDGRAALALGEERYDVIEADALRPHSAFSGNLYSVEFFRLCAERLRPGGIMATWAPTVRVRRSLLEVFPHVVELPGAAVLIASREPISGTPAEWAARADSAERYLGKRRARFVSEWLADAVPADRSLSVDAKTNHDLFPRDEFLAPPREHWYYGE